MSHSESTRRLKSEKLNSRFWSKVRKRDGWCWLWTAFTENGYGMFWRDGRPQRASRVAWEFLRGPIPKGLWVLHKCDVRSCVNPDHLYLGTVEDNVKDMMDRGRQRSGNTTATAVKGEACSLSKLKSKQVLEIRRLHELGLSERAIGRKFGVEHNTVGAIIRRRTWKHI